MSRRTKVTDPASFEGNGISFRAKIIGIDDAPDARGDKMCQEMIQKLKISVKISGQHKQRIFINVTLDGLKIIDGTSMLVLHTHPVHQISFISRDVTDSRAFGYIYGPGDGTHKFFGIKTANAAENLVLTLRDLFQTVYEMKKKEIAYAKAKAAAIEEDQSTKDNVDNNYQVPPNGKPVEGQENIYQVPRNNAPVCQQEQEEAAANLLDLEDQADTILKVGTPVTPAVEYRQELKGIEQIKNLEFDDFILEAPQQNASLSTVSTGSAVSAGNDPWGVPSSSLSDLQQLSLSGAATTSNPFGSMQAFLGNSVPAVGTTVPGYAVVHPSSMHFGVPNFQSGPGVHLPVTRDPFGDNPFQNFQAQHQPPSQMPILPGGAPFDQQSGFGFPFMPSRDAAQGQPFPGAMAAHGAAGIQPRFGMAVPTYSVFSAPNATFSMQGIHGGGTGGSLFSQSDENILQPIKPGLQEIKQESPKPTGHGALFGDLLDMKKSAGIESSSKSPKEMFKDLAQPPKKSLNEIKGKSQTAPKLGFQQCLFLFLQSTRLSSQLTMWSEVMEAVKTM